MHVPLPGGCDVGKKGHERDHLWRDPRTGIYIWKRTIPGTKHRRKQSTGAKDRVTALAKAKEFEEEFRDLKAGLAPQHGWKQALRPLAEKWLAFQEGDVGERSLHTKRFRILRVLDKLRLETAADLTHVGRLAEALKALERDGTPKITLRRCYQEPLKQFSAWLAADRKYLDHDPLATWKPLRVNRDGRKRRHWFHPDLMARALLALDRLDEIHRREHAQRLFFVTLLVTAPRVGALISRDVSHLDRSYPRIDFGPHVGKKRKGVGALDPVTAKEIASYVGERREGTLFLSPEGQRPTGERLLDVWREAYSLGVVDLVYPADEPKTLTLAFLASRALLSRRVRVSRGGNPNLILPETREILSDMERRVARVVAKIEGEWTRRMEGVDVYSSRKTHETWARAQGVHPLVVDKQLGHTSSDLDGASELRRVLSGSETGRKHYLDLDADLFDPRLSAVAVRGLLDEALARVSAKSMLARMSQVAPGSDEGTYPKTYPMTPATPSS